MIDTFKFNKLKYEEDNIFCARIRSGIKDKNELLTALYYQLWLPCYFGFNWDALQECMIDFSWIKEKKIIIIHDSIPELPDDQLKIYLDILTDSISESAKTKDHIIEVVFPEKEYKKILNLLKYTI